MKRLRAFVLIEVLVAIFILAIIFSFIYTSYHGTITIIDSAEGSLYFLNTLEGAAEQIYYDITSIFKLSEKRDFNGDKDSLRFFTTYRLLPQGKEDADFTLVEYTLCQDPQQNEYILMREGSDRKRRVLTGIRELELGFFDGLKWRDKWDSKKEGKLPQGIRIRLLRRDEEGREKQLTVNVPISVG